MILRLVGAAAVLVSTSILGYRMATRFTERPRQLRELISSVQFLETEINYGLIPLPEAFGEVAARCRGPVSHFYRHLRQLIARDASPRDAWVKAVEALGGYSSLKQGDLAILRRLGDSIGRSDRFDQVRHLQLTAESLKLAEKEALQERDSKAKLWFYLGWATGVCLVILLY